MKTIKRTWANFSFYDSDAIAQKLEDMAAKGWMLRKVSSFFWTFEQTEPRKRRFAVTYFPGASGLDPRPSQRQLDKEDLCAQDGWQLVLRWDAMMIFCTDREDAVPIDTDPVPQVETLYRTMRKKLLSGQLLMVVMILWSLFLQLSQLWRDPAEYLSDPGRLYLLPMWLLLLVGEGAQIVGCFRWQRRARRAAEQGVFLPVHGNKWLSWGVVILSGLCLLLSLTGSDANWLFDLIFFAMMALCAVLAYRLIGWLKKKGVPRTVNVLIATVLVLALALAGTFALVRLVVDGGLPVTEERQPVAQYEWRGETFDIYDDPLPRTVEDLAHVEARWTREAEYQESAFLSYGDYRQSLLYTETGDPYELQYSIIDVKVPALEGFVLDRLLARRQDEVHDGVVFVDHYGPVDPSPWQAQAAWQLHWSDTVQDTYLVSWGERIVEITFYWPPTEAQIRQAAEILKP